ncbi:hypothetical protein [Emcibacter sp. SYSU 3D8]|uniref:hypothetical protein n=1 Tax=Emcibacter sp. SYSU 3D8 TaxID=3133969 RepID=UPI0031FE7A8D
MPIHREVELPMRLHSQSLTLPYRVGELTGAQARLQGRYVVEPDVDVSGKSFACSAEVDWLVFGVSLRNVTQSVHVSTLLSPILRRQPHVEGPNGESHYTGNDFRIRVQQPKRRKLDEVLFELDDRWGLVGEPRPLQIEVSLDFYPKDETDETRRMMVGILQRHFLAPDEHVEGKMAKGRFFFTYGNPPRKKTFRIYSKKGATTPLIDSTVYFGKEGAPVTWRIMDKTTDDRKGVKAMALMQDKKRARIEVTLGDATVAAMGLETLDDLKSPFFTKLRKPYFEFRLPTFDEVEGKGIEAAREKYEELRWSLFAQAGVYGLLRMDRAADVTRADLNRKRTEGKVRAPDGTLRRLRVGENARLVAYGALHRRIGAALRNLNL